MTGFRKTKGIIEGKPPESEREYWESFCDRCDAEAMTAAALAHDGVLDVTDVEHLKRRVKRMEFLMERDSLNPEYTPEKRDHCMAYWRSQKETMERRIAELMAAKEEEEAT